MGEGAFGCSLSLVAPAEDKAQAKIHAALSSTAKFDKVILDGRLMTQAQERVNLASKIVVASELEQKMSAEKNWFMEKAKEADLELDEDLLGNDDGLPEKEEAQLREAKRAKKRLVVLLSTPMRTQRYGKFLATNSAVRRGDL